MLGYWCNERRARRYGSDFCRPSRSFGGPLVSGRRFFHWRRALEGPGSRANLTHWTSVAVASERRWLGPDCLLTSRFLETCMVLSATPNQSMALLSVLHPQLQWRNGVTVLRDHAELAIHIVSG